MFLHHCKLIIVAVTWVSVSGFGYAQDGASSANNLYVNQGLGIKFSYPKYLSVHQQGNHLFLAEQDIGSPEWRFQDRDLVSKVMSGKRAVEPESYVLHIRVEKGTLEEINRKEKVFSTENRVTMSIPGRFKPKTAQNIVGENWVGYKTDVVCGIKSAETGYHAAGGCCYWAIGGNGIMGFVVDTLGQNQHLMLADQIVQTIQLSPH